MDHGWSLIELLADGRDDLHPVSVGGHRLMIVRHADGPAVFDASCPHRGASLAHGGEHIRGSVTCPFHGRTFSLDPGGDEECLRRHRSITVGGVVFALLSESEDRGFGDFLAGLMATHTVLPGFTLHARVAAELVIENAFDADHFQTVHGIDNRPTMSVERTEQGALTVRSSFATEEPNPWQKERPPGEPLTTSFVANVFSPTLVASELGTSGETVVVFTSAVPTGPNSCVIRLAVAVPTGTGAPPPTIDFVRSLLRDSRTAFDQDLPIWENLDPEAPQRWAEGDDAVIRFRQFCEEFAADR